MEQSLFSPINLIIVLVVVAIAVAIVVGIVRSVARRVSASAVRRNRSEQSGDNTKSS